MRICFISVGTFNHIGPYLEYFKQAGHDVHFICLSPSPERNVPTYNVGLGGKYSQTQGKWKYPLSMFRARRLLKKLKPDIVHAHYVTSAGLTALVCGFHPTVVTAHGSDLTTGIKSRLWRPILKRIFEFADCVNVVSEDLAEMALSLGINKAKIEVLTLGVDTEKFPPVQRNKIDRSNPLKMVCTRRLELVFDHTTMIRAMALLKIKGIKFELSLAGDGSLLDELKQQVRNLGLDDSVTFMGKVAHEDLPELLSRNDVYLSASLWDGTSLSLLEAMASGLFPIVSDIKANSAWLRNGVDGFLHKVGNAEDLANCILRLLDEPEIVQKACPHNRQSVVEKADRNKNMKRLETIYQDLVYKSQEI
jgi:glycosyltransferase involved in cell wall biosynthesis